MPDSRSKAVTSNTPRVPRRAVFLAVALALAGMTVAPSAVLGYNKAAAVTWAENHWNTCGTALSPSYPCFNDDCTNFVSQSLHQGGYPYRQLGSTPTSDDHKWYMQLVFLRNVPDWRYTYSWSYAQNLKNFLILDAPGGYVAATYRGDSNVAATAANAGDVYFYDWDGIAETRPIDHASINVGYGTTLDGLYGDYVDAHTTNHHHAFWTLQQYNQGLARYTTIYAVVVSTAN